MISLNDSSEKIDRVLVIRTLAPRPDGGSLSYLQLALGIRYRDLPTRKLVTGGLLSMES